MLSRLFKAYIKIMFKEIWQNPQDILIKDSDRYSIKQENNIINTF